LAKTLISSTEARLFDETHSGGFKKLILDTLLR
jgi:hypothetical protein